MKDGAIKHNEGYRIYSLLEVVLGLLDKILTVFRFIRWIFSKKKSSKENIPTS